MNKKSKVYILSILLLGLILIIGTYAWFTWRSSESRLVLTIGEIDDARVILKPYKIDKEIIPVLTYEGEEYTEIEAINKNNNMKRVMLYYHINNIDNELISSDFKYTILRSSDNGNTYSEYITGNFSNTLNDSDLYILNERLSMNTDYKYQVYLWLDSSDSGQGNISGKSFNGELRAEILDGRIYANLGGENELFKADEYREKITKIEFVEGINIPEGAITFDLGAYPSKIDDVKGWLISNGTDTYTLNIGANDKIYAKSFDSAFRNMINVKEISFANLDTSYVVSMERMFQNCSSIVNLDLRSFNTSNVINMATMFCNCNSLVLLDINSFDTSNVIDIHSIFNGCSSLTSLDLNNFDTSKVTNMAYMFYNCTSLISLDLRNFDTSNVNNMELMFGFCHNITSLNISNFNTLNVSDMNNMFYQCFKITSLDLSSFNTSNVTNMIGMFVECNVLTNIYVSNLWNTSLVTSSINMFIGSSSLPNYNSSVVDKTNAHYNTGGYLTYRAL